ncbi:hypothetical protein KUCAC02_037274 [Chaenocephalus aceratus]|nr:hypothetical protein KUCAC02_037274 [Chaenocephalus aceratus]
MKELAVVLSGLVGQLGGVREEALQSLGSLQDEHNKLQEQIRAAQDKHQAGMKQTMQFLQDQLGLISMETQSDFSGLHSSSSALQRPLTLLQDNISSGCGAEKHVALQELTGYCSHLHGSVSGLVQRDLQWSSRVGEHAETQAQEHLSLLGETSSEAHTLQQSVETRCADQLRSAQEDLTSRQAGVQRALEAVQEQTCRDRDVLGQQQEELRGGVETGQQLVTGFLQEELQQDVPTGATPQRREFVYPRRLERSRSRAALLESLRRQQEELQAKQHSLVDHDSLEDLSTFNESLATEPSFIDENLVFNEGKRVPFFKHKKSAKKEMKIPPKQKVPENESTPQKSRLPLRSQN